MALITGATYIPSMAGLEELARSPGVTVACLADAEALAAVIKDLTPVRATPPEGSNDDSAQPGVMRDSVVAEPGTILTSEAATGSGIHRGMSYLTGFGGGAIVIARDSRFHWIEFGAGFTAERDTATGAYRGEMSPVAPFRRAAELTGRYVPTVRSGGK